MVRTRIHIGLLIVIALLTAGRTADAQTIQWTRQFGTPGQDRAFAIAADATGVYVAGATEGVLPGQRRSGAVDAFLRRYDVNGTEIWTRQFGTPVIDEVLAIAVDATGIYVAGDTHGILGDRNAPTTPHAFIRKYDREGAEIWTREFGTGRIEEVLALSAGTRGVVAAGDTTVTAPPYDDGFVTRFTIDGGDGWTRPIATRATDRASAIVLTSSGIFVAGATQGVLPGQVSVGDSDAFLRKYDIDGNELWTRQFGTEAGDEVLAITADESGVYVSGMTFGTLPNAKAAGETDAFVRKFDPDGRELWTRQFGTDGYDDALAITAIKGVVFVAGNTMGTLSGQKAAGTLDAFVRKYDVSGIPDWTVQFGTRGHDEILGLSAAPSGIYGAGVTDAALEGQTNSGSFDAIVIKFADGPAARPAK